MWHVFALTLVGAVVMQSTIRIRNVLLLLGSYALYLALAPQFVWVLMALTCVSFLSALLLTTHRSRLLLFASISMQLSTLVYYKYTHFFLGSLAHVAAAFALPLDVPTRTLLLPLGISFYTFQAVGYTIDVYRGTLRPEKNFLHYALFLSFFPKMSAGPIERAQDFLPQLKRASRLTWEHCNKALALLAWGAVLKFAIADNAALIADPIFSDAVGTNSTLPGVLAYTLQIFADFSGYSLMAKGAAAFVGIELSWNFDKPYLATNPQDFWRRWHITLSNWVKDYVYIPLGGNRKGAKRTLINLFLTMALVGLWHGATWMFVLWGMYHGLLLCIHRMQKKTELPYTFSPITNTAYTFVLVALGWILFRSPNLWAAWGILRYMTPWGMDISISYTLLLWLPVILMHGLEVLYDDKEIIGHLPPAGRILFYYLCFYVLLYLTPFASQQFIYIQF